MFSDCVVRVEGVSNGRCIPQGLFDPVSCKNRGGGQLGCNNEGQDEAKAQESVRWTVQ